MGWGTLDYIENYVCTLPPALVLAMYIRSPSEELPNIIPPYSAVAYVLVAHLTAPAHVLHGKRCV